MDLKIIGASNIFVALLVMAISVPLVYNKIPMNHIYGIRFKQSFESQEKWYKINAYGGRQLIAWSIPLFLLGVATFFLPLAGRQFWIVVIAGAPLIYLVPALINYVYAKQLR
jgi:hypothetical protein